MTIETIDLSDDESGNDEDDGAVEFVPATITPKVESGDVNELLPDESIADFDSKSDGGSDFETEESRTEDVVEEEEASDDEQDVRVTHAFIEAAGVQPQVHRGALNSATLQGLEWRPVQTTFEDSTTLYPELIATDGAPTFATRKPVHSPSSCFLFMPKVLWVEIAADSNLFWW